MNDTVGGKDATGNRQRLIIYDLEKESEPLLSGAGETEVLFCAAPAVKNCVGCFGCWIKTPGSCILKDRCNVIPELFSKVREVIIISPVVYGGYSPGIKAVMDRSIGYVLPYFRIIKDEMHHRMRYQNPFKLNMLFYGKCDDEERETAQRLVKANAVNFGAGSFSVRFFDSPDLIWKAASAADAGENGITWADGSGGEIL